MESGVRRRDTQGSSIALRERPMRPTDPVNRFMSTPTYTVELKDHISQAVRIFADQPLHHLPVVQARRVVGVLSSADVSTLDFFSRGRASASALGPEWTVERLMKRPPISVTEHESIQKAAELMQKKGIHSLPVVNSNDELVGIVTTTDIIRASMQSALNDASISSNSANGSRDRQPNRNTVEGRELLEHERVHALEELKRVVKRYLNAGQDERLHQELRRAIERADGTDPQVQHEPVLGLTLQ
jgi:CBS domain-containing membrane protein